MTSPALIKHRKVMKALEVYALENDQVNSDYYIAKVWLNRLISKTINCLGEFDLYIKWLESKSTLDLTEALSSVGYKSDYIDHFNAMCLIDSIHVKS